MEREVDRIISTLEKGEEFFDEVVDHFDLLVCSLATEAVFGIDLLDAQYVFLDLLLMSTAVHKHFLDAGICEEFERIFYERCVCKGKETLGESDTGASA
jgi:hypothetical protein